VSFPTSSRSLCLPPARMHFCVSAARFSFASGPSMYRPKLKLNAKLKQIGKQFIRFSCQALNSTRFQHGCHRVNLHRLTLGSALPRKMAGQQGHLQQALQPRSDVPA